MVGIVSMQSFWGLFRECAQIWDIKGSVCTKVGCAHIFVACYSHGQCLLLTWPAYPSYCKITSRSDGEVLLSTTSKEKLQLSTLGVRNRVYGREPIMASSISFQLAGILELRKVYSTRRRSTSKE